MSDRAKSIMWALACGAMCAGFAANEWRLAFVGLLLALWVKEMK